MKELVSIRKKNIIIKTKTFNYKAYIPVRYKSKNCLKNKSQKVKDKIVNDSIYRNSYKNNAVITKKINNSKKYKIK